MYTFNETSADLIREPRGEGSAAKNTDVNVWYINTHGDLNPYLLIVI